MGYYTRYTLDVPASVDYVTVKGIEKTLLEISQEELHIGAAPCDTKWYDHEKHMMELSLLYPDIRFQLEGVGKEQGDVWKQAFLNGKASKKVVPVVMWPPLEF